jgi:hypothetical protein
MELSVIFGNLSFIPTDMTGMGSMTTYSYSVLQVGVPRSEYSGVLLYFVEYYDTIDELGTRDLYSLWKSMNLDIMARSRLVQVR